MAYRRDVEHERARKELSANRDTDRKNLKVKKEMLSRELGTVFQSKASFFPSIISTLPATDFELWVLRAARCEEHRQRGKEPAGVIPKNNRYRIKTRMPYWRQRYQQKYMFRQAMQLTLVISSGRLQ